MKTTLILVLSCQPNRENRQATARATWARHARSSQRILFVEGGHRQARVQGDRLLLESPDGYDDLAEKAFDMYRFCYDNLAFEGIVKCDDDTYLDCDRLMAAVSSFGDYCGHPADDQEQFTPYARGGCYWVSRRAVEVIIRSPFHSYEGATWYKGNSRMRKLGEQEYRERTSIEDVMVGDLLNQGGIPLEPDHRFHPQLRPTLWQNPRLLSNHYVSPHWMERLERQRTWPSNAYRRFLMWLATCLPSAKPPR